MNNDNEDNEKILLKSRKKKYNKEYGKKYRAKNSEYIKQYRKANYLKHKDKADEYKKNWYQRNKEKLKQKRKEYYFKNKEKVLKSQKEYNIKNKDKKRKYIKEYNVSRRKKDIGFRILGVLRTRLYNAINKKDKKESILILTGCTSQELKIYLEKKFKDGMSWENYGIKGWHIDHIKPCSSFDLKNIEQQKQCFHYTNLQPLWWWENLSKGKKDNPHKN